MPRVIALGGASAAPNAGQGCSGFLVEEGSLRLVLDLGPGTLTELLRHCELSQISGILITHLHPDHLLDLIALWWGWLHHPLSLPAPIPLWLPPGGTDRMRATLATLGRAGEVERFFSEICSVEEHSADRPIQIQGRMVSLYPTVHYVPTWAARVDLSQSVVAYTADTGPTADLSDLARDADLLIAEAMLVGPFEDAPARGSSTPEEAARLGRDAGAKRLLLTHFWSNDEAREALPRAREIFTGPVEVARPGLTVSWD